MSRRRAAFTLFELILAIALAAVLLAVIGMAIDLYLTRVATSRDRVEEAQLARSILSRIADDLRATAVYQPQDVSGVAQLMSQSTSFDVDSIDNERSGSAGGAGGTSGFSGAGSGTSSTGSSGGAGSGGTGASSGSSVGGSAQYESEMPLGVNGDIGELYVDIERLPRGDELFGTLTGYTNAPMAVRAEGLESASGATWGARPVPSDVKTVRYYLREGDRSDASGLAATSLETELLEFAPGGLVRQEIPHPARLFAEQYADSQLLESGQTVLAPEVVHIEFRYFDGEQVLELWEMAERRSLPIAIEISIWLTTAHEAAEAGANYDVRTLLTTARPYRQTVYLPMAQLSQSGAAAGMSGASSGSSSSGSSSSGASSSSTGSGSSSSGSSAAGGSSSSGGSSFGLGRD